MGLILGKAKECHSCVPYQFENERMGTVHIQVSNVFRGTQVGGLRATASHDESLPLGNTDDFPCRCPPVALCSVVECARIRHFKDSTVTQRGANHGVLHAKWKTGDI